MSCQVETQSCCVENGSSKVCRRCMWKLISQRQGLWQLSLYCLSALSLPFFALLSDTGAGPYKHFFFTTWSNVNICQQRALEGYCKVTASEGTFLSGVGPPIFFYSVWELSSDIQPSSHQGPAPPYPPQAMLSSPIRHCYRSAAATTSGMARGCKFPLHLLFLCFLESSFTPFSN